MVEWTILSIGKIIGRGAEIGKAEFQKNDKTH